MPEASVAPPVSMPDEGRRASLRLWLITSMTFTEFLHGAVAALNAGPIMGDIGVGPREYSMSAAVYATAAITAIALQRWAIERLGWRRFVQLSVLSFAAGIVVVSNSHELATFLAGRVLMAFGGAMFMTSARVLVNHAPPSPARFKGIRAFAMGLGAGTTVGPLLATMALDAHGWRTAFLALLVPAAVIACLAPKVFDTSKPAAQQRSQLRVASLILLMASCLVFLHALQQASFDFFADAAPLWLAALIALCGMVMFVRVQTGRPLALIRFAQLAQPRFLVGSGLFAICYLMLAANNYAVPLLLQRGMGLPLEQVGHALSIGALAGLATLTVLMKLFPRYPGPTRYYATALSGLLVFGLWLGRLNETAHPWLLVLPALVAHGFFIVTAFATTATQTFKNIPEDEALLSHANQVKNMVAQFASAVGIAVATLLLQWRSTVRYTQLVERLGPDNPAWQATVDGLAQQFAATQGPQQATQMAVAQLGQLVTQEATLLAAQDYFHMVAAFAVLCIAVIVVLKTVPAMRAWFQHADAGHASVPLARS